MQQVNITASRFTPAAGNRADSVSFRLSISAVDFSKRRQSLRLYADPGTTVTVETASRNFPTPNIGTDTEVSGCYVDVP